MNIIFLDIDGVIDRTVEELQDEDLKIEEPEDMLAPHRIDCLKEIVDKTNAKIVISSIWRLGYNPEGFKDLFKEKSKSGVILPVIDTTRKRSHGNEIRGDLVNEWLNNNHYDKYIILDDDSDFYENQNLVLIDNESVVDICNEEIKSKIINYLLN